MDIQTKMFLEIERWIESDQKRADFIKGKEYSKSKFNYWLAKWKAIQEGSGDDGLFQQVDLTDVKLGKVLEIEAPSGVKITVFA
jgi:hypothetical protein